MAIVVDEPIINDPFVEPTQHYRVHGTEPELRDERRPSGYTPGLRSRGGQSSILEEDYVELPIVNAIRQLVRRWREAGYPGATRTTLDLLAHWTRADRDRRLFFCQLEAAETAIWLVEGPQTDRVIASALEQQEAYTRHCVKMATGSGKTIVMGMLIAWSLLNKARQPTDRRFSDAADDEGEQPLLPVLNDLAPIGSTEITPYMTTKPAVKTLRSHLSHAVVDSGWERTVAHALDESPRVRAWVKNERLGFEIPYRHGGTMHRHVPDFLVELGDGTFLVVEVKGLEREQDRSKEAGARRWIDAVNHWGKLGRWRYAKIYSPHQLTTALGVEA